MASSSGESIVRASRLCKSYGAFRAVKDLSFEVRKGEVVGFLGPNGAGKSTTLRMLAGYLGPSSGHAWVNGHSVTDSGDRARESIGYMPESAPLYPEMRVREYLGFRAELKRVPRMKRKAAVGRAIEAAILHDVRDVLIGQLSKGYRQRVGLADALVASPPLLILDEPTAGLDPNQIRDVRALVGELSETHTILLSTHILSEVEAICSRAVVIARGELVAEGTLEELRALQKPKGCTLRLRGTRAAAKLALGGVSGLKSINAEAEGGGLIRVRVDFVDPELGEAATEHCVARLAAEGLGILEVRPLSGLEHVFAKLTEDAQ